MKPVLVVVKSSFALTEREAREVVKDWVDAWLDAALRDSRVGVNAVSFAARNLRSALQDFERGNSGDNGK